MQVRAHSARRRSLSCRFWRRKLSRSGFRAQYPSLVSFDCCKTTTSQTIRVVSGFFQLLEVVGVLNFAFCKTHGNLRHAISDPLRRMYASTRVYFISDWRKLKALQKVHGQLSWIKARWMRPAQARTMKQSHRWFCFRNLRKKFGILLHKTFLFDI